MQNKSTAHFKKFQLPEAGGIFRGGGTVLNCWPLD